MSEAVVTYGLSKRYGRDMALDHVDLRVPEGAVYVLVGANGAGKSTALKVLMNLERPDAGRAAIFGFDSTKSGAEARAQVGYVPEHHAAGYRSMRAGALLQHAASYYPSWDTAYATHLSDVFDVRLERRVGTLSKGEARRLQLVLALAHRPPLLLLDEPTDGLDPMVRNRMLSQLAAHMADTATTLLISTHQIAELESLADHVGALRGGRLVCQMAHQDLVRTVRRYRLAAPDGWQAPPDLPMAAVQRSSSGRELEATFTGEERAVVERLAASGAQVSDVRALSLEAALLTCLTDEVTP